MATQLSKEHLRGLLIPYKFAGSNIWKQQSTYTEEEINADTPEPNAATRLFLGATGSTDAASNIQILTSDAGIPETARFTVRDNSHSTVIRYGYNNIWAGSDWELFKRETALSKWYDHDAISFDDGSFVIVCENNDSGHGTPKKVVALRRDRQGVQSQSTVTNLPTTAAMLNDGQPAICKLPDNSVICVVCIQDNDQVNCNVYRSLDRGMTWSLAALQVLSESINVATGAYTIEKVRVAALQGQVLLIFGLYSDNAAHTNRNQILQYASIDAAGTFQLVTDTSQVDAQAFYRPELFINRNGYAIAYISSTDEIRYMPIPHAFHSVQDLQSAGMYVKANTGGSANDFASGTDSNMTGGELCAFSMDDESINIIYKDVSDNAIIGAVSLDGTSFYSLFTGVVASVRQNIFFMDTSDCLKSLKAIPYKGSAVLVHGWTDGSTGDSIAAFFLGGYTNLTYPYKSNAYMSTVPTGRMGAVFTWLPIATLNSSSQLVSSGTGTETLNAAGYTVISVSPSQASRLFTKTNTVVVDKAGIGVRCTMKVIETHTSGSTPAYTEFKLQLNKASGDLYRILVRFSKNKIWVYQDLITLLLIAEYDWNNDEGVEWFAQIVSGKAVFYYRQSGDASGTKETAPQLRHFIQGFNNHTLTALVGTATESKVILGINGTPSGGGNAECAIYSLQTFEATSANSLVGFSADDLIGKKFPSAMQRAYVYNGISVTSQAGPTFIGDEWQITPYSPNSVEHIFHSYSPSPRVTWRSAEQSAGGTVPEQRIALQLSTNPTDFGNNLLGLHLSNINFRECSLQYYNGASWVTLKDIQTWKGMKHGYFKVGKTIKQDPSNVFDRSYYFFDELKGCIAVCHIGGEQYEHIRIVGNSEGVFGDSNSKKCVIELESEPSNDGTVYIIPVSMTAVIQTNAIYASAWALRIPAQTTIDDCFVVGALCLGSIVVAGRQYSKGRRTAIESGTISSRRQDGTTFSRAVAPEQRNLQLSWSDGVDQSAFYNTNPDPDFYRSSTSAGNLPVSVYQDAPYLLEGILRRCEGSMLPIVYLPSITTGDTTPEFGAADLRIYNRRNEHLYCTLDSEISITSVTGEELMGDGMGEVMRVGTVDFIEVL